MEVWVGFQEGNPTPGNLQGKSHKMMEDCLWYNERSRCQVVCGYSGTRVLGKKTGRK